MAKKKKPAADQHLGQQVKFYASADEVADWKRKASELGYTLSGFLRALANGLISVKERK